MERTSKNVYIRVCLCLFLLCISALLFGQNLNKDTIAQKYISSKCKTLFSNPPRARSYLTDDLSYEICVAQKTHHKLLRVNSAEESRNAFLSSFAISLSDQSREQTCPEYIYLNQSDKEVVKVGVRCFTAASHFVLVNVNEMVSSTNRCFSFAKGSQISVDTILTEEFVAPKGVIVAKVEKVRNRYVFMPLSYGIDECGIIILTVPNSAESIFAFYDSSKYLRLIRFIPNNR